MEKFDYLKSIIFPRSTEIVTPVLPVGNSNFRVIAYSAPARSGNTLNPGEKSELVVAINARNTYVGVGASSSILVYHATNPVTSGLLDDRYGAFKARYTPFRSVIVHSIGELIEINTGTTLDYKLYVYHKNPLHLAEIPSDLDQLTNVVSFTGSVIAENPSFVNMAIDVTSSSLPDLDTNPESDALYPSRHFLLQLTNNSGSPVTYTYTTTGRISFPTPLNTATTYNNAVPIEFAPYILYFIGFKYSVIRDEDNEIAEKLAEFEVDISQALQKLSSGWLELTSNINIRNAGNLVNFIVFYLD